MPRIARTRPVAVSAGTVTLSGLVAEPDGEPRALVVALHGHGMSARYFTGPADGDQSLLELGAELGFTVWAPDRVGYGASADVDPALLPMFTQAEIVLAAIDRFAADHAVGAGRFLVGHSFGLKLSLTMASSPHATPLIGIDGSGSGLMYAFEPGVSRPTKIPGDVNPSWGPRHLYPPATFARGVMPAAPTPPTPSLEVVTWPDDLRGFAHRITVPVRFTFGDHERLWVISDEHFDTLRAALTSSPRVVFDVQQGAGHNVSLSKAGRAYHLKALAFAHECLLAVGEVDDSACDQRGGVRLT